MITTIFTEWKELWQLRNQDKHGKDYKAQADTAHRQAVMDDKLSRSNRCYLSTTVGLISQNNLRMVTAVTVDMKSRCQQLFITKKIIKAKS